MGDVLIAEGKAFHPSLRLRADQANTPAPAVVNCNMCGRYYGDETYHPDYPTHLPTSDPHVVGAPWLDNHVLKYSEG